MTISFMVAEARLPLHKVEAHDRAQPKRHTDHDNKTITCIPCNRVCIDCFAESLHLTFSRKAPEPGSRQSYTPEPMTFDEATELGGETRAMDTATAAPPAFGVAGEDDEEEMDEESSEDVCTNLLTSMMNNTCHFLTLWCVS
jgi:hypothetical protein